MSSPVRFSSNTTTTNMILNLIILLAISIVASASNIAAYWGQNAGGDQQTLGDYCSSSPASIIILSFLDGFPNLLLNFANQCSGTFSSGLAHCSQIGSDIKSCQQQGKTILLSLGGATGNYRFSSDSEAVQFAGTLWNKFGGGKTQKDLLTMQLLMGLILILKIKTRQVMLL